MCVLKASRLPSSSTQEDVVHGFEIATLPPVRLHIIQCLSQNCILSASLGAQAEGLPACFTYKHALSAFLRSDDNKPSRTASIVPVIMSVPFDVLH